tara:strand:+ start:30627 stop:31052 length:426 start_codon:yes stop_codon:yes gene_type:complete
MEKEHNAEAMEGREQTGTGEGMLQADNADNDDNVPQEITQTKNPKYRKPEAHLDNPWSHATWKSKARKPEMLKLLEEAGERTRGLKAHSSNVIIGVIIRRREQRAAAGLIPPEKMPKKRKIDAEDRAQTRDRPVKAKPGTN